MVSAHSSFGAQCQVCRRSVLLGHPRRVCGAELSAHGLKLKYSPTVIAVPVQGPERGFERNRIEVGL